MLSVPSKGNKKCVCVCGGRGTKGGSKIHFFSAVAIFNELSCHYWESEGIRDLKRRQKFHKDKMGVCGQAERVVSAFLSPQNMAILIHYWPLSHGVEGE